MNDITSYDLNGIHAASRALSKERRVRYRTGEKEPEIPAKALFEPLILEPCPQHAGDKTPSVAQAAAHLELLEAFMVLRKKVCGSRALDLAFDMSTGARAKLSYEGKRDLKWKLFVDLAVVRFKVWYLMEMKADRSGRATRSQTLPPLDVLVVWHAFMLNTKDHAKLSTLSGLIDSSGKYVPDWESDLLNWNDVHKSLDSKIWNYSFPTQKAYWDVPTLLDLLGKGSGVRNITQMHIEVRDLSKNPFSSTERILFGFRIDTKHTQADSGLFIRHTVVHQGLAAKVAETERWRDKAIVHIKTHLKKDRSSVDIDIASQPALNRAWTELSTFNFADAVHRQSKFVDKMCHFLWLRSPTLESTLINAQDRYKKFFGLFKLHPGQVIVPTLDVDLIWHTHMLSPDAYRNWSFKAAGRMIDHDDTIGQGELDNQFEKVKLMFWQEFGEEYLLCHCWTCEGCRAAMKELSKGSGEAYCDAFNDEKLEKVMINVIDDIVYHRAVEIARRKGEKLPLRRR